MSVIGMHRFPPATVGYIFGPSTGNNTTYQKFEAEAPFTRVRVWHFSLIPGLQTRWESCIAPTETAADDNQDNRYKSVQGGTAYNAYGTPGFVRVTYNGGQSYGDMTDIGVSTSPNMRLAYCHSDWIDISSIARDDGGTLPLLLLRTHHDSTQYGHTTIVSNGSGATPWITWPTASAEPFFRVATGQALAGSDGVGTLSNMPTGSQSGNTAYHTALEFDYGVFTRSFIAVGDSITAGGGGQIYVFDCWATRGILPDSTTSKPRTFVNCGQSSQTSTTYFRTFQDMIDGGARFTDVILSGFSPNDVANSVSMETRLANLQIAIDTCKSIGARVYISTGCPANYTSTNLTNWLANNDAIRTLCSENGYILLDWAHLLESSLDSGVWGAGLYQPDLTHPSIDGIELMASTLDAAIPEVNVIVAAAGGGNWTDGSTWVGGIAPTAADDVQLDATSGNVTINATAACRSLDCVGGAGGEYAGTLTHNSSVTLSIGDATAGVGNRALRMSSGMTYTAGSISTSIIAFVSTSATQQSVDWGGKTFGRVNFSGSGSFILVSDQTGSSIVFTAGSLDLNDYNTNLNAAFTGTGSTTRSIKLGNGTITLTNSGTPWAFTTTTNLTFDAEGSTIEITNTNSSTKTFQGGGLTYNIVNFTGGGSGSVLFGATGGGCTFARPWQIAGGTKTLQLAASTTHTFLLGGNFGNGSNLITIAPASSSAGFKFMGRFNGDYLNLTNITADGTGVTPAYAGTHSVDNGGNTNWSFTVGPSNSGGMSGRVGTNSLAIGLGL